MTKLTQLATICRASTMAVLWPLLRTELQQAGFTNSSIDPERRFSQYPKVPTPRAFGIYAYKDLEAKT